MNHFSVSIIKSIIRIAGCVNVRIRPKEIMFAFFCFLFAEVLGIFEEFADKRKEGEADNED